MLHSGRFVAVLDSNVLYPAPNRDLLLSLGAVGLYIPRWSEDIQNEWTRNLLRNRKDLTQTQMDYTVNQMNIAFPDATVYEYEAFISSINLPDPDDRHVLAASIKCNADVIVTDNLSDFPADYLCQFNIEPQRADLFISNLIDINPEQAMKALTAQVARLKNPPQTVLEVLRTLESNGLVDSVDLFRNLFR